MKNLTANASFTELFSTELWTARQIGHNRLQEKVIPVDVLEFAFQVCRFQINIDLHKQYLEKIGGIHHQISGFERRLKETLVAIEKASGFRPDPVNGFDVLTYLNKNSLRVHQLWEWRGKQALCYPVDEIEILTVGMRSYHSYCFYRTYQDSFSVQEFIDKILPLKVILERVKVADYFVWDDALIWPLLLKEAYQNVDVQHKSDRQGQFQLFSNH